ncbi:MAG: FecR domain-containing protein, partial [Alphaproteobacteria bacterium]|nr:FecR domain-containing protein [Alphaproteobacteria bacterium]
MLQAPAAEGVVVVPGKTFILGADYQRQGADLVLTGGDGAVVVVRDFFAGDTPPDLVSEAGQLVRGELATLLAGPQAPGQYAQIGGSQAAAAIGKVEKMSGTVNVTHTNGSKSQLKAGDPVYQGDVIETGKGGSIGILFTDKTTLSLGEGARMALDSMVFDPNAGRGSLGISVLQGAFLLVSGEIAKVNPEGMSIKTPVATIGIRGTSTAFVVGPEGTSSSYALARDPSGNVGQIVISNGSGTTTLSGENQAATVSSFYVAPSNPVTLSRMEIVSQMSTALTALPAQPALFTATGGTPPSQAVTPPSPTGGPAQPGA